MLNSRGLFEWRRGEGRENEEEQTNKPAVRHKDLGDQSTREHKCIRLFELQFS